MEELEITASLIMPSNTDENADCFEELETLLGRYNNVQFYDADYKTYGIGATEVRIFQNVQP